MLTGRRGSISHRWQRHDCTQQHRPSTNMGGKFNHTSSPVFSVFDSPFHIFIAFITHRTVFSRVYIYLEGNQGNTDFYVFTHYFHTAVLSVSNPRGEPKSLSGKLQTTKEMEKVLSLTISTFQCTTGPQAVLEILKHMLQKKRPSRLWAYLQPGAQPSHAYTTCSVVRFFHSAKVWDFELGGDRTCISLREHCGSK